MEHCGFGTRRADMTAVAAGQADHILAANVAANEGGAQQGPLEVTGKDLIRNCERNDSLSMQTCLSVFPSILYIFLVCGTLL
jgi:hypothetical protein